MRSIGRGRVLLPTLLLILPTACADQTGAGSGATLVGGGETSAGAGPAAGGGLIEKTSTHTVRPRPSSAEIQAFLPAARGSFRFPPPYNTEAARLTSPADCGGADCVQAVGYSYWRNINNHVASQTMLILLGLKKARGGGGPTLFSYDKTTRQVRKLGPLFVPSSRYSEHSGEGWYFSGTHPTWLYLNDGPRLLRYDVMKKDFSTVFDVTDRFGRGRYIWQAHSSDDDSVHSATLREESGSMLGCLVYREQPREFLYYRAEGDFDECQVDRSGRWLVIKDNVDRRRGEDNRIVDLETGSERVLLDEDGAAGHSDNGHGYMVADDNWNSLPGAVRVWRFDQERLEAPVVFHRTDWEGGIGHISHTNARPGVPVEKQYACGGTASRAQAALLNEILCFRLDTSLDVLVVAPVMTDLDAPGGGEDYDKLPKGNLDVTGQYFVWTSNTGGARLDAFLVEVPAHRLVGGP
jgi:hypothetical protein